MGRRLFSKAEQYYSHMVTMYKCILQAIYTLGVVYHNLNPYIISTNNGILGQTDE